jgi:LytS/YehU family sensor histidine kinase
VAMQRMRKDENYNIVFSESPDVEGFSICPLLLIPFVENAFKHVSHSANNEIRINLRRVDNTFRLSVFNTKEKRAINGTHNGIGLKNARRRLDLLYGGRHELVIRERPEDFEVHLSLQIDSKEPLQS